MANTIHTGDCLAGMQRLPADSVGTVATSPPYNLNIKYGTYADDRPRESYLAWLDEIFQAVRRVLRPDGHFFLNMGYSNADPWVGMDAANTARRHFVLQNNIAWVKSVHAGGRTTGNFKPVNSGRYATPTWEHLFHFTHDGEQAVDRLAVGVPYECKANAADKATRWRGRQAKARGYANFADFAKRASAIEKQELNAELEAKQAAGAFDRPDLRCRGNVWCVPYEPIRDRGADRGGHPATFPAGLAEMCVRFGGCKGPVLDPFMGTGSTAAACENIGIEWLGFEIDENYADFANKRIASLNRKRRPSGRPSKLFAAQ